MNLTSTILIVDDNPTGQLALEALLAREGYVLTLAGDGWEALKKATDLLPDVILLDVMMPDIDGIEVCQRLRADPRVAEVSIIMVTAFDDHELRMRAIEAGADDYVTKPITDVLEFRARIRTITRLNRYRRLAMEREQRQQAEEKMRRQLQRLAALHDIDQEAAMSLDLNKVVNVLVHQIPTHLGISAVSVLVFNSATQMLEHAASYGFQADTITRSRIHLGEGLPDAATLDRTPLYISDITLWKEQAPQGEGAEGSQVLSGAPFPSPRILSIIQEEQFSAYYVVPLVSRGRVNGVIELFHHTPIPPEQDWLDFLETLGGQAAIALDNAELFANVQQEKEKVEHAYGATLEGWISLLDLRDNETEQHTRRVTEGSVELARAMGFSIEEQKNIYRGALLHDIGKMGVPDHILHKPGPLTDEEWAIMRQHPTIAYNVLAPVEYLHPVLDIPYCHHEKWDGTGYPRGLRGEEIPLAARIFAIIDVWDALTSDRPYRSRWSDEETYTYLRQQSGKHFDPQVVEAFLKLKSA